MTPLEIQIGIHYATTMSDFRDLDAPAIGEAINRFVDLGMLEVTPDGRSAYAATHGMRMWVESLCQSPLPERRWVFPEQSA